MAGRVQTKSKFVGIKNIEYLWVATFLAVQGSKMIAKKGTTMVVRHHFRTFTSSPKGSPF